MKKECTILTFDETERLRQDLDSLIETLKNGENGEDDPKNACSWGLEEAREIRKNLIKKETLIFMIDIAQNIKDCGQSLIDNAEKIATNLPKYTSHLSLTCYPAETDQEIYINVSYNFAPEKFIDRICAGED